MIPRRAKSIPKHIVQSRPRTQSFPEGRLYSLTTSLPHPRFSLAITKKALPHATDRNRLRRQLLQELYKSSDTLAPHDYFILINRPPKPNSTPDLLSTLSRLMK